MNLEFNLEDFALKSARFIPFNMQLKKVFFCQIMAVDQD